jgi:predicted metal-binding protein
LQKCECCGRTVYNTEKELKWYQEYEDEHLLVCPECYKELMQLKENE